MSLQSSPRRIRLTERFSYQFTLSAVLLTGFTFNAAGETQIERPGEWLQFRGDKQLSNYSPLKGSIQNPKVHWRFYAGARETWFGVSLVPGSPSPLSLPVQNLNTDNRSTLCREWNIEGPWYEREPGGHPIAIGPNAQAKTGRFLAGVEGLQQFEFDSAFEKGGTAADETFPTYGYLRVWENGGWQTRWQSEAIPLSYIANTIVGDFDRDGATEVAAVPWYDLWVLDAATGKQEAKTRYQPPGAESGRAYGWLGAFDLDSQGNDEFIIIADFENHIDVLGWKDGQLQVIWQRLIEKGIERKKTVLRMGVDPVQDVDGDGLLEIVIGIYNEHGDETWHALVLDGMTGDVRFDFPHRYVSGVVDVDGDRACELLLTSTRGLLIPTIADLSMVSLKSGQPELRWSCSQATFQTYVKQDIPPNINTSAGTGLRTLLTGSIQEGGRPVFITSRAVSSQSNTTELTIWQCAEDGTLQPIARLQGPQLDAMQLRTAYDGKSSLLVRALQTDRQEATLVGINTRVELYYSNTTSAPLSTIVVGHLQPHDPPAVIAQCEGETIKAFRPSSNTGNIHNLWQVRGRGACTGGGHMDGAPFGGVVLADGDGDRNWETFIATQGEYGCARITAIGADGRERWHRDFARFPGETPVWNIGGLTIWQAGRFTHPNRDDIIVSLRRSTMHSDETFMLDGRNGNTLWHRTEGGNGRGCGGDWLSIFDCDGDGLDDAFNAYPDAVNAMKGTSGEFLLDTTSHQILGCTTYYGTPFVTYHFPDRNPRLVFAGCPYALGVFDLNGHLVWRCEPPGGSPGVCEAIGDMDGDGKTELFGPGFRRNDDTNDQDFHCYDLETGSLEWKLPLSGSCFGANGGSYSGSPTGPASADIDGDGLVECIFTSANTIYAVGYDERAQGGEIRWKLDLPSTLGPVTLADTHEDGQLEILVVCADGFIYGIGH